MGAGGDQIVSNGFWSMGGYARFVWPCFAFAGLVLVYLHLPDYRAASSKPLDIVGLILFGSGIALLSYVLEIFGEHALGSREILGLLALSVTLIVGYGLHATRMDFPTTYISGIAYVARDASIKIVADLVQRRANELRRAG